MADTRNTLQKEIIHQALCHMDAQRWLGLHVRHVAPRKPAAAHHQHVLEVIPPRAHAAKQPPHRGTFADERRAAGEEVYRQHAA